MGEYAVPLVVAIAAIALTYVFCLRPMRRHSGGASGGCCAPNSPDSATTNEISALRREIEVLRQSMADPADAGSSRTGHITN